MLQPYHERYECLPTQAIRPVVSRPLRKEIPMMTQIVCLQGPLAGQHFAFDNSHVSFGRTSDNTIQIASRLASRQHASISREAMGYVLRDNDSRNGTRVNGEYTSYRVLRSGDEIAIGNEVFRFEDASAAGDCTQVPRPTGTVTF